MCSHLLRNKHCLVTYIECACITAKSNNDIESAHIKSARGAYFVLSQAQALLANQEAGFVTDTTVISKSYLRICKCYSVVSGISLAGNGFAHSCKVQCF